MLKAEIHQTLIELRCGFGASRHIRIIHPHYLNSGQVHAFQLVEIRKPPVLLLEVVAYEFGSCKTGG